MAQRGKKSNEKTEKRYKLKETVSEDREVGILQKRDRWRVY